MERGEGGPRKELIIAGIATSVVVIGAGVGFVVASNAHAADAERKGAALIPSIASTCWAPNPAAECRDVEGSLDAKGTFKNLSVLSFVVGGVVVGGTATYALTAPRSKEARAVRAIPFATASSGGIVITGRW